MKKYKVTYVYGSSEPRELATVDATNEENAIDSAITKFLGEARLKDPNNNLRNWFKSLAVATLV